MNETEKLRRLALNMTQTELAKALKVSQPQIHRLLTGKNAEMLLSTAKKLDKLWDKVNPNADS